jgi:hypothetical protein
MPSRLVIGSVVATGLLVVIGLLPTPAPAQALSGFDVFRSHCDACHELYDPEDPKRTRKEWETILTRMVKVRGATLNQQEFTAVLNYLDSFNRPKREIQWNEAPAKTHKATLAATDAGKLPAEWVDLTIGADEQLPWAVQSDPATKALYLAPLKTAEQTQLPALIDNSGIVQNGSASARMQILSGEGALGAGIVFGFRNTQSFYGVRISPKDVVLYEVQGGQRALLARAPLALPVKQWHTVGVDVNGKAVKVTVNGKPVSLDRTLAAYQGGRMGVHTQGDTVALFDQWQVTVR